MSSHDEIMSQIFPPPGSLVIPLPPLLEPEESYFNTFNVSFKDPGTPIEDMKGLQVPKHPIPAMQGAFGESMLEASMGPKPANSESQRGDAITRRLLLLDQDISEETHASKWKQKPGQRYHELWKLIAQISFGSYLLFEGIAKDDEQVLNILQGHVDEVDAFLEATLEDFDHAQDDIDERLKCLKIPLENIHIFDGMMEDRQFRLQIVQGNERIEHVITRTALAMNDALKDVQQGMAATKVFAVWLAGQLADSSWERDRPEMQKVFDAMKGNVEGWYNAYISLQTKGSHLGRALVHLGSIVAEMDRRAGEVSRKTRFSIQPGSTPESSDATSPPASSHKSQQERPQRAPSHRSQPSVASSTTKDLPSDPSMITPAIRAALPAFQMVSDRERTPEEEDVTMEEEQPELPKETSPAKEPSVPTLEPTTYSPVLQARTYSPVPRVRTPKPPPIQLPPTPDPEPVAIIPKKSSLRDKFSLKRKEVPPPLMSPRHESTPVPPRPREASTMSPRQMSFAPGPRKMSITTSRQIAPSVTRPVQNSSPQHSFSPEPLGSPRHPPYSQEPIESPRRLPVAHEPTGSPRQGSTAPSRSRQEFVSSPRQQSFSTTNTRKSTLTYQRSADPLMQSPSRGTDSAYFSDAERVHSQYTMSESRMSPNADYGSNYVSSPRSDQQHFRPVRANPNSPLQRPWTAAPTTLRAPSTTNLSTMSQMTTVTEGGTKIKKKRSGFGWLRKAFSLSDEEKAAFEARRRGQVSNQREFRQEQRPQFLDGRRIR